MGYFSTYDPKKLPTALAPSAPPACRAGGDRRSTAAVMGSLCDGGEVGGNVLTVGILIIFG
jgi:hypothetical protein